MTPDALTALIDGTWPAAAITDRHGWTIREGRGGGSRVSAATAARTGGMPDIDTAEAAMVALGQTPIFMIREGEEALDTALEGRGYTIKDPVTFYTLPLAALTDAPPPPVSAIEVWPPLAIMEEIWATGGIGPARLAIMERVPGPKTAIFGRASDKPAGVLFAAIHDGTAMLHAIETGPAHRRKGVARNMMRAAAHWAARQGADTLALLVTRANGAANPLYTSLGMTALAGYHYRIREDRA